MVNTLELIGLKKDLVNNVEYHFKNDDSSYGAECTYRNSTVNTWANGFKILFNGKNYSYKTFEAFVKKLNKLIEKYNLEFDCKI